MLVSFFLYVTSMNNSQSLWAAGNSQLPVHSLNHCTRRVMLYVWFFSYFTKPLCGCGLSDVIGTFSLVTTNNMRMEEDHQKTQFMMSGRAKQFAVPSRPSSAIECWIDFCGQLDTILLFFLIHIMWSFTIAFGCYVVVLFWSVLLGSEMYRRCNVID